MKNLIVSIFLFAVLIFFGLFVVRHATEAQNGVVSNLLNLPAPPPNPSIEEVYRTRTQDFLNKSNPPKDDAPIEDVLEYWENQNNSYVELDYNIAPASGNLERILGEIKKKPESLTNFLNILPENPETTNLAKRLYERALAADENFTSEWKSQVKRWLTYHSDYFSEELLKKAQTVGDADEYVTNQGELLALARVDWEKARPILERLIADEKQPVSQTLARWAFYQHALAEDDGSDIEKYRNELKGVVEDKNASAGMRDLAIDALVKEKEWQGRDDWYVSLLGDETLFDLKVNGQSYTGLTTLMYYAPPEKYRAKMLELAGSNNAVVRNAAVRNLVMILDDKNPEIIRALLPWLENPDWAKESGGERQS